MRGIGTVIGVDLNTRTPRIDTDEMPGSWALLRDRLRPSPAAATSCRHSGIPDEHPDSLQRVAPAHARKLTDFYLNPPLDRVGLMQWDKFEEIVQQGYTHAVARLDAIDSGSLARMGAR